MSAKTQTITWKGRARRLAFTTGEGDTAKREAIHVRPGETYEIPADVSLAGEGTNWEKGKPKAPDKSKEEK